MWLSDNSHKLSTKVTILCISANVGTDSARQKTYCFHRNGASDEQIVIQIAFYQLITNPCGRTGSAMIFLEIAHSVVV